MSIYDQLQSGHTRQYSALAAVPGRYKVVAEWASCGCAGCSTTNSIATQTTTVGDHSSRSSADPQRAEAKLRQLLEAIFDLERCSGD